MIIAFDLDGTLADITHRLHFIQSKPKDWKSFFAACVDDEPIEPIVRLCYQLMQDYSFEVEIWSGRSDEVRTQTDEWLRKNWLGDHSILRMRKVGDYRPDHVVKGEWFDSLGEHEKPVIAFDDRQQVVDMWRSKGVICCQVAPGNF